MNIEELISINERLIYSIATKFPNTPKEDLFQAGVIGIIKAYNNYKQNQETKFTTYAYKYIFGEMYELSNNYRTIKLNKDILKTMKKIEEAKITLSQMLGYMPSITELSIFLNIDEQIISDIYNVSGNTLSLDNQDTPLYDILPSEEPAIEYIDIQDSLNTLSPLENAIIDYRYFKDYTQNETAKALGLSQVKVSRYEKKSLSKMYNYLSM